MSALDFYSNTIKTIPMDQITDFERIDLDLKTIIKAVRGTLPGSRGFGLMADVDDDRPIDARNDFAADLDEQVATFMPEIIVTNIDFTHDMEGYQPQSIYIERNPEVEIE